MEPCTQSARVEKLETDMVDVKGNVARIAAGLDAVKEGQGDIVEAVETLERKLFNGFLDRLQTGLADIQIDREVEKRVAAATAAVTTTAPESKFARAKRAAAEVPAWGWIMLVVVGGPTLFDKAVALLKAAQDLWR